MLRLKFCGIICLISCLSYSQNQVLDSLSKTFVKTIVVEDLTRHLEVLASDTYEGRETGEKGQKLAAEYIASYFKSLGIPVSKTSSYFQNFPLIEQHSGGVEVTLNDKKLKWKEDFYAFPTLLVDQQLENLSVVFVGEGIVAGTRNDYSNVEVKNKIALIVLSNISENKQDWGRAKKIKAAKEQGAKAVIFIEEKMEERLQKLDHYIDRSAIRLADERAYDTLPVLVVNTNIAEEILEEKWKKVRKRVVTGKDHQPLRTSLTVVVKRNTKVISSENVLGFLEGTDKKEELIVITAHYDHLGIKGDVVFNGADDDGSGTVSLLELAEAFVLAKRSGHPCRRSILFMAVSGEEKGLLGSQYYVEHPIYPLEKTMANLNIDMIGRHDASHERSDRYVYVIGAEKISKDLHDINERSNALYTKLDLDYKFNDEKDPNRFYYRSDHYNFAKKGVPVIFYFSGVHEDYHKSTDTVEKIEFERLTERCQLVFLTAWNLVNRESPLKHNETK
jgi:hypothetical protein